MKNKKIPGKVEQLKVSNKMAENKRTKNSSLKKKPQAVRLYIFKVNR